MQHSTPPAQPPARVPMSFGRMLILAQRRFAKRGPQPGLTAA